MTKFKIIMAQLNLLVGDIDGNTALVLENATRAIEQKAQMVIFPELTLTGYPPEDLLLRPSLQLRIEKALQRIVETRLNIACVIGYPEFVDGKLHNTLVVIQSGKILAKYYKQCLPNYQVFDERRYFKAGSQPCVLEFENTRIGFTICEDMWEDEPIIQARDAGAQLLINISASPYSITKLEERTQLMERRCQEGGFPIIYLNLVGGQDELVFDGASMVVTAKGECRYLAPMFEEDFCALEISVDDTGNCHIDSQLSCEAPSLESQVYSALVMGVRDYVNKNGFEGVVLGLSGGIDSALTLAVAVDALGSDRVQAVMMPFEYTSQLSLDCAAQQADLLGVNYQVIAINEIYAGFMRALAGEFAGTESGISEQNIQARARGVILMGISNKKGLLVLTTGNKSEIAVGYSTLYGDMAGGFDALKDVSKTLVYKLARFRNESYDDTPREVIPNEVIERAPSAELAPGQVDQDSLPDYDILDQILELYVEQDASALEIIARGFAAEEVNRVLRLVDLNEYKRRQSPIGVRLTERGFGRDRRYPITNAWPLGE